MDTTTLLAGMGGNRALLREMTRLCLEEDGPRLRAELRAAAETGDRSGVEFAAHALKGLVAEFRAESARAAADALEHMAATRGASDFGAAIEEFDREYEKFASILRSFLEEPIG